MGGCGLLVSGCGLGNTFFFNCVSSLNGMSSSRCECVWLREAVGVVSLLGIRDVSCSDNM